VAEIARLSDKGQDYLLSFLAQFKQSDGSYKVNSSELPDDYQ